MFTLKNYYSKVNEIDRSSLSKAAQEGYDFMADIENMYGEAIQDSDIKNTVEKYLELLNIEHKGSSAAAPAAPSGRKVRNNAGKKVTFRRTNPKKQPKETSPKTETKAPKQPKAKVEKQPKTKAEKQPKSEKTATNSAANANTIQADVKFIKRFVNLDGDTKTKEQILRFIQDLQKAIAENTIGKKSKYAEEIMDIQKSLISLYEKMGDTIVFKTESEEGKAKLERLTAIAEGQSVYWSIYYAKRIINLKGRETKDKANKLKKEIENKMKVVDFSNEKPYNSVFVPMFNQLKAYLSDNDKIVVSEAVLYGLKGFQGLSGVMSSYDLKRQSFNKIGLKGKIQELLGDMTKGAAVMIKGREKMGKSTLALKLAKDLSQNYGTVLYVSYEEHNSPTLQGRADRLNAYHNNLHYAGTIPANVGDYDFVFIDSFGKAKLTPTDIETFRSQYPNTTFFYIFRTTKSGEARGTGENAFEVDTIIDVENGTAQSRGRFGAGTVKIY